MNTYWSTVNLVYTINEFEADSKEEYIKKVIANFKEEFDIDLDESEIHDIEVIE